MLLLLYRFGISLLLWYRPFQTSSLPIKSPPAERFEKELSNAVHRLTPVDL
jgi:hypothetical protein